jgi:hypothetical protein
MSAGIPTEREPVGLTTSGGKRPDGLMLIPRHAARSLTRDATAFCTLADSCVDDAAHDEKAAAELAAVNLVSIVHQSFVSAYLPVYCD